jgi:hypothetical protein
VPSRPAARLHDLVADHYTSRINMERRAHNFAAQHRSTTGHAIPIRNGKAVNMDHEAA